MATFEKLKQFEPGREAKTVLLLLDVTEDHIVISCFLTEKNSILQQCGM